MSKTQERRLSAYVGFDTTPEQRDEIRRRAERDGRPVAGWLRDRLALLFELDNELIDDRSEVAERAFSQSPQHRKRRRAPDRR